MKPLKQQNQQLVKEKAELREKLYKLEKDIEAKKAESVVNKNEEVLKGKIEKLNNEFLMI